MLTVVKVGGGVGAEALRPLCAQLGALGARYELLVVPGGAWFADAVRETDRRFALSDGAAHRMAILGMEQFGCLLRDLLPGGPPVVSPAGLALDALPESWQVTSDSIAAFVAGAEGAGRLVLVKAVDGLFARWPPDAPPIPRMSVSELAALRPGGVDAHLPTLLAQATFETWVIGPERLPELLERGETTGTRIASGRLLRLPHG